MKQVFYKTLLFSIIFNGVIIAQGPQTFSVQGVLRDPLGKTVLDGSYQLDLTLYTSATGMDDVWNETQPSVLVKHGVFNVELGLVESLDVLPFNVIYYLGIAIDNGQELVPRQVRLLACRRS